MQHSNYAKLYITFTRLLVIMEISLICFLAQLYTAMQTKWQLVYRVVGLCKEFTRLSSLHIFVSTLNHHGSHLDYNIMQLTFKENWGRVL